MKVDTQDKILNYDGKVMTNPDTKKPVVLRDLVVGAVNTVGEKDTGEDKMTAYEVSSKMYTGKVVDLTVEEMNFILKKAAVSLVPVAYGRLRDIFNT